MSTVLKKSLAGILAACALMLAAGMFAVPAYADISYVKAGDTYIYSDSESRTVGTVDGVSYDAGTMTLTLKNADISADAYGIYISGATNDNVKVVLKGTNAITATGSYTYGIDSGTALTLSGTNLTLKNCYYGIHGYSVTI